VTQQRMVYRNRDGVRRTLIWDDDHPDKVVVQTEQVLDEILAGIARDREIMRNDGDMKVIGRPPVEVVERAVLEQWDEDDWRKWWNGEGRAFRIWKPGGWL
jgi:hypothetical protein